MEILRTHDVRGFFPEPTISFSICLYIDRSSTSSRKDHSRKPYDRAARDRIERSPGRRRSSRGDYPTSLNPDERWDSHRSSSYREQ
jgi:hypothetical protein